MTNNGGDMHGSQFFITLGENLDSLDGRHSVFGEVADESYDVLAKINEAYTDDNGRPYQVIARVQTPLQPCASHSHVKSESHFQALH